MLLLHLPNQLPPEIASWINTSSLSHLICTNTLLHTVFTPLFHASALEPKDSLPPFFWAITRNYEPPIRLPLLKGTDVRMTNDSATVCVYSP